MFQKIKNFLYPFKYAKLLTIFVVFLSFLTALVSVYIVIFLKYITRAIENNNWEQVKFYSIIWFILITIWFFIRIFYRTPYHKLFWYLYSCIYRDNINIFFKWNNNKVEKIWTWRIISIIQKWVLNWITMIWALIQTWLEKIFIIILIFINIWISNLLISLIWIGILLLSIFWAFLFYSKALKWRKKGNNIVTEIDRLIVLHIMNKFEIFQNNKQNLEIDKMFEKNFELYKYKKIEKIWQWLSYDWAEYFINLIILLTAFYFWYLVFEWKSSYSDFVLYTWFATLLWNQINGFVHMLKSFWDNYVHVEKLGEFLDEIQEKEDIKEKEKKEFVFEKWDIQIKNINFSYWENKVFDNFSLKIKAWTKTAFVWKSWWGKTTLIKLLASYIKIDSWNILVDNQKLSDIKMKDYYDHIGYLTQDPSVFDGTILENLIYSLKREPSREELEKIIKLSKCEFIYDFKDTFQTEIGERGIRLSWWQKQRLAIAKIMLKNPNIILLDEPTSALDSFNEELINKALHNLFNWKTVIVIAHRLQTVKEADRIILFENWKIIEDWNHRELIKLKWKYKKMLDLQSGF